MNFFNRLTTAGKAVIIVIIVAIIGAGVYFSGLTKNLGKGVSFGGGEDYDLVMAVNTYSGHSSFIWGNGGLTPNDSSIFVTRNGLRIKILIMDDFEAARSALLNNAVNIEYCTMDALPVEMDANGRMSDIKYFMLLNFSNGADALVVDGTINTVKDLKGKKVAYAEGTASHTLLINTLETAGMTMSDIVPVKVASGIEAAQAFKSRSVEAAACWSPDDEDCLAAIKNSHILTSTADASNLVSDGLIAKKEWLENNKELAAKLVEAILYANSEIQNNQEVYNQAAQIFAKSFETDVEFALTTQKKIKYATLQDELNWMGLNTSYGGMNGERLYTKMSRTYTELGLCKNVMPWSKVVYTDIVESVAAKNNLNNNQEAAGTAQKEFSAPTTELQTAKAISEKKVTVNFPTAGYTLDNAAQTIIDKQFVDIVQTHSNQRVRISGNTDNTGNYDSNVTLSKKRAQAVVDYLVKEYKINPNQFVVVGNGPKKAIAAGVLTADENYRTTDIELIAE